MTIDELSARFYVLESFCVSSLGIIIAMTGPDPGKKKAISALDAIKNGARRRLAETSSDQRSGEFYLDELLSVISDNLGMLRPKDGQSQ
jgi:hypothetical protein